MEEKINEEREVSTKVAKNKEGYGYKYTDLAQIHEYLEKNNMRYYQEIETDERNGYDYILTYRYIDGKWEEKPIRGCRVVDAVLSGIKNPAQEQGSALTYARRYSLLMAFGLATDDDDAQSLTMPSISTLEEAKSYKLTFGKYANKTLGEVPENYLQWLFENTKDENIRTACDFIMEHITKSDVDLMAKMQELILKTNTDIEKLYENYGVKSNMELSEEQIKDAISVLEKKLKKGEINE